MQAKSLQIFDGRIQQIQAQLAQLGPMRPGTLTRQYRRPERRQGPYYQLSYTYRMQSHTEYVPQSQLGLIRQEIAVYRHYKKLTARWIDLALQRSRLRMVLARSALPQSRAKKGDQRANVGRPVSQNSPKSSVRTAP